MKKFFSIVTFMLLSTFSYCCSCMHGINAGFYENIKEEREVILVVFKSMTNDVEDLGAPAQTGHFKVIERLRGSLSTKTDIVVLGINGVNCNENLTKFSFGDTLVLALDPWRFRTPNDTFRLSGCVRSYLEIEKGSNDGLTIAQIKERINGILTSTEDISIEKTISVFPNPASTFAEVTSSQVKIIGISILDQTGRELIFKQSSERDKTVIDLSSISKGLYKIRIQTESGIFYKSLTKQ